MPSTHFFMADRTLPVKNTYLRRNIARSAIRNGDGETYAFHLDVVVLGTVRGCLAGHYRVAEHFHNQEVPEICAIADQPKRANRVRKQCSCSGARYPAKLHQPGSDLSVVCRDGDMANLLRAYRGIRTSNWRTP